MIVMRFLTISEGMQNHWFETCSRVNQYANAILLNMYSFPHEN